MASIGKMRDRVTIYEVVQGQPDGIGGFLTTKESAGSYWALVEQLDGARFGDQNSIQNTSGYMVTLRAGAYPLTVNNILEYEGQEMTINSLVTDNVKRYTICQCQASL